MSRRGIGFLLIFVFFLILAMGTGIRELFFVAITLGFVFLFSIFSCLLAALTLICEGKISNTDVQRNENVTVSVFISGIILLPCICDIYITVPGLSTSKIGFKGTQNHVLCLLPGKCKTKYGFDVLCAYKGIWQLGIKHFSVHDIFGLFSLPLMQNRDKIAISHNITVHPKAYEIDNQHNNPPSKIGLDLSQLKESDAGESLSGSRVYQYGDPLKRINWKQTAKTRELYVRKFELEQNPQVLILLDTISMYNPKDCVNLSCDIAATLTKYYLEYNCTVRTMLVRIHNKNLSSELECSVSNTSEYTKLDDLLVAVNFNKNSVALDIPLIDSAQFSNANTVLVISSNPSDVLVSALETLYEQDYNVLCIIPTENEKSAQKFKLQFENSAITPVTVFDAEQIPEKIGGCL